MSSFVPEASEGHLSLSVYTYECPSEAYINTARGVIKNRERTNEALGSFAKSQVYHFVKV